MTIEEIESNLPNGFHDASLQKIEIDYLRRTAVFDIEVSISTPDEEKEEQRLGRLTLTGLLFCVIDPPGDCLSDQDVSGIWIADSGKATQEQLKNKFSGLLSVGAFAHYFFINDWNAFIYLAAMDARFEWG